MAYYIVYVHLLDHFLEIRWNEIIVFCGFIATHSSLPFFGNLLERSYRFLRIHCYPFITTHLLICHHFLEIRWNKIIVFCGFISTDSLLPFFGNSLEQNYCFLRIHSSLPIHCYHFLEICWNKIIGF